MTIPDAMVTAGAIAGDVTDDKARQIIEAALAAEPEVKIMPRGGVERDWWTEYQLLLRRFKKLAKAARQCVDEVDANLTKDDWPVKYRAPFGALIKLREALPKTYEEFKVRKASLSPSPVQEVK
jgi:hypothetical protein